MEEVQKNENGTTVPQADGKPKKEDKPKRELTPQQVQQRRKMIVFPLMFLAFAGCMYLIFAPSGKEDVNVESVGGFNADIMDLLLMVLFQRLCVRTSRKKWRMPPY